MMKGLDRKERPPNPKEVQFPKQWNAAGGNHEGPK